jgi:hypothetical protein
VGGVARNVVLLLHSWRGAEQRRERGDTLVAKSRATKGKAASAKAAVTTAKTAPPKVKSAAKDAGGGKADAPIDAAWVSARTAGMKGEDVALGVPMSVFLGESLDCATFLRTFWKAEVRGDKVIVPGMESAAKGGDGETAFGLHTADEIVALHNAAQAAHTEYLLATKATKSAQKLLVRGAELLDQWTAALEWAFDDGVEDDKDAQFAAVQASNERHEDTIDGMASALADFGGLVQKYANELTGVLDFDPATVDEGLKLSAQLRETNALLESNPEARAAKARRNNALALLQRRVARVRKAARLVFRGEHAEIARKVTSAYQRRARALARRAKAKGEPTP